MNHSLRLTENCFEVLEKSCSFEKNSFRAEMFPANVHGESSGAVNSGKVIVAGQLVGSGGNNTSLNSFTPSKSKTNSSVSALPWLHVRPYTLPIA